MSLNSAQHFEFRQDLNGLRGAAIILVALFHGWNTHMPNGRLGVDIFFVLSGYLISSIIFKERANGSFTLIKFYSRRIKRLAPALIFFLAYLLYHIQAKYETDKKRLKAQAQQIMAGILMAENFYHIKMIADNSTHWYGASHLWTLAIEQQFYIVWPLLTGFVFKLSLRKGTLVLLGLIGLSLWSQFFIERKYEFASYCKFLPFARFWEFLVGSLLAFVQFKVKFQSKDMNRKTESMNIESNNIQVQSSKGIQKTSQIVEIQLQIPKEQQARKLESQQISGNSKIVSLIRNVKQLFNVSNFQRLIREILPLCAAYKRIYFGSLFEHAGLTFAPIVISSAVIIESKNSLFNRYFLSTKLLLLCGDISYPFYLWHFGLQQTAQGAPAEATYGKALFFSILSFLYVEPLFRRSTSIWAIPFLILAQIAIFIKAYSLYSENV